MLIIAKTTDNRQAKRDEGTKRGQIPYNSRHHEKPQQTDLTSCPLHATFERYSVNTKIPGGGTLMYKLYGYVPLKRVWFSSGLVWDRV